MNTVKPETFALPCPWCGSVKVSSDVDRWDENEVVGKVECHCSAAGPLVGGNATENTTDMEWDLMIRNINESAWMAWNIRGGPSERLSDAMRFGEAEEPPGESPQLLNDAKPCPFCASQELDVEDYGTWVVGCSNCLARAPHDPNDESPIEGNPRTPVPDDIREAVERWNNRKDLARPNHITEEA